MTATDEFDQDDALRAALAASVPPAPHLDEDLWVALLEGRLTGQAREDALDHVSACPRCAGVFKQARAAALAAVPAVVPARTRGIPQLATLAATIAVAAVTIVVVRQGRDQHPTPPTNPGAPTTPPAISAPATPALSPRIEKPAVVVNTEQLLVTRSRAAETAYLESLARALEPYQRDEFREAAQQLAVVAASRPEAFEPAFYLGVSLLLDGRAREALPVLQRAQTLAPGGRRDEATRYLDLAREAGRHP